MDLFVCDNCGRVDAVDLAYPSGPLDHGKPKTRWDCTKCQTGHWHNYFDYDKYRPDFDIVINRSTGIGLEVIS
jgi:hypothetical protein